MRTSKSYKIKVVHETDTSKIGGVRTVKAKTMQNNKEAAKTNQQALETNNWCGATFSFGTALFFFTEFFLNQRSYVIKSKKNWVRKENSIKRRQFLKQPTNKKIVLLVVLLEKNFKIYSWAENVGVATNQKPTRWTVTLKWYEHAKLDRKYEPAKHTSKK